ncbi:hypothetical protein CMO96_02055, partial [Candidatus Woesebacteria bacterium]|nr:hypothetical protein [Candidatus Woesebacteria bacterium]
MKKKKILFHSNYCKAFTGFGKNAKNILSHLTRTGKYEIVEFCNGVQWGNQDLKLLPWKCEGSIPDNPSLVNKLKKDPNLHRQMGYGAYTIDKIIEQEKPDIYIGVEDIWAFSKFWDRKWWNRPNCMVWTTLDSLPILPNAVQAAPKIKNYYTWSTFAARELNKLGHEHVKCLHGSVDTEVFFKYDEETRNNIRKGNDIALDEFIIGFVFRNQLRKSVPNLLDGFKEFLKRNRKAKAKLLLHTSWAEGWDIPRLLKEKGIDNDLILTSYFCSNCCAYKVKPFAGDSKEKGEKQACEHCGSKDTQNTTNVKAGVNERQLNEIYNIMDVYCHPFTSGGQELPVQEAKLSGLITLVTNYSCGEDGCTKESGGLPLDWAEYREPGTQFIKASTLPASIAKQLTKVYKMPPNKRLETGLIAHDFVVNNYSVDVIGKKLEEIFDDMPYCEWDFDFSSLKPNPNYKPPEIKDDSAWLKDLYANILKLEVNEEDSGHKHWMAEIKEGKTREDILKYFKNVAQEDEKKQNKTKISDLLDKDDEGKRILYAMPQSIGDVYLSTSILPNIKKLYPDYNLYFATQPKYYSILDGNPHVHKVIPYFKELENLTLLEGRGDHKGYFEIAFLPFIGTQRVLNYMHNGKDKIQ